LAGLLVARNGLGDDFSVVNLNHDATGVAHIRTDQLLAQGHNTDTSATAEPDIQIPREQFFIRVEEGVVEGDADLVGVEELVYLAFLQVFAVLSEHKSHLRVKILRQSLLQIATHFLTVLAMAVRHRKKVAVLEAAEMRHGNPAVLVYFVGVGGRGACLRSEGKFGHAVGEHLLGV